MRKHTIVVTDVKMKIKESKGMKAICSIVINDMIAINDIRLIEDNNMKLIVAMPSKRMPDQRFKDSANPVNPQARKIIEDAVLAKYNELTQLPDALLEMVL